MTLRFCPTFYSWGLHCLKQMPEEVVELAAMKLVHQQRQFPPSIPSPFAAMAHEPFVTVRVHDCCSCAGF